MKISVVITCYNLGQYLNEAVASVENQTVSGWELIIVDDGSSDDTTLKILQKIETETQHRVIRQKNSGLAAAKNMGVKQARGEYIVCLDADDILAPEYLEKTIDKIEKSEDNVAFVTTWLQEFGLRKNLWKPPDFKLVDLLINNVIHAASMFRKSAWEAVGGFKKMDIGGYEDWNFWLSLVEEGFRWDVIKEPLFFYRIRQNSMLTGAKSVHSEIYAELFKLHKNLFAQNFDLMVLENAKEMRELHETIAAKDETIRELETVREEVISLRDQLFRLRDELNSMRNARVLGRVIKAREFIGKARKRISLKFIAHRARVIVAPIVPRPVRRFIKKEWNNLTVSEPTVQIVQNKKWTGGPLVSIVIPYYNRADTIDETLDSLKTQTLIDFETIVIDDGSTEQESVNKLQELEKAYPHVKFIHQKNQGVATARNNGVAVARGKYVICLDSDDSLTPTFIEKCTIALETDPDTAFVTTYLESFGVVNEDYKHVPYDALEILKNNMVITAAQFRKEAWKIAGGYKPGIGYEDWDFWVSLSEKGFWGRLIPEPLFRYRTAMQSRYVGDKDAHWENISSIKKLHPKYKSNVKKLLAIKQTFKKAVNPASAFYNLGGVERYSHPQNKSPNILILVPWLTFGGAETVILDFCNEIKGNFNLTFMTGVASDNEWEHKFKEITERIYHLPNLFEDRQLYLEFISNYVETRHIDLVHIIHTDFAFEMLEELKKRHPSLKIAVTLFNDRAAHFEKSLKVSKCIDVFSSDNWAVHNRLKERLGSKADIRVIPNGVSSEELFNPILYDRTREREALGLKDNQLAVFFIGRLSEEKNPDVFVKVAEEIIAKTADIKFFVIGDGPIGAHIKHLIDRAAHDNLCYLGYKSKDEVAHHLSAADIFVLPSSIEGFPPSIIEAMAMKVAVIASDVGAVSEIIEHGKQGLVVKPGSAEEIAKAIGELSLDRKKLEIMKLAGRKKVESNFSTTKMGANYRSLYNYLVK